MNTKTTEILKAVIQADITDKICSKIEGRRNWVIRFETVTKKITFNGGFGQAKRRGATGAFLIDMAKYGITWVYFTYKKDYEKTLNILLENGYTI